LGFQVTRSASLFRGIALLLVLAYFGGAISSTYLSMGKEIGVVRLTGSIYSFRDITDQLSTAEKDPRVKALVLYVNSPGGAAFACMEIRRYLDNMTKPNIAVMDELAASGAYYIASAADEVMAHENTITGSLGVIAVWEDYSGWMKKEGIKYWVWKTGEAKDLFEPWRSPTADENESIRRELNRTYEILVGDIANGRANMSMEDVKRVANSSVYSGSEAKELGLVDSIGDFSEAVRKVAGRVKLKRYLVRDMSQSDKEVLASLAFSYFTSDVTWALIVLLIVLSILSAILNRRERPAEVRGGI